MNDTDSPSLPPVFEDLRAILLSASRVDLAKHIDEPMVRALPRHFRMDSLGAGAAAAPKTSDPAQNAGDEALFRARLALSRIDRLGYPLGSDLDAQALAAFLFERNRVGGHDDLPPFDLVPIPLPSELGSCVRLRHAQAFRVQYRKGYWTEVHHQDPFSPTATTAGGLATFAPTDYAFHGSPLRNWWSIVSGGLTLRTDRGGGIYGGGIYLARSPDVADQFVESSVDYWAHSRFAGRRIGIVGGFQILRETPHRRDVNDGKYVVMEDPAAVRLRHLFIVVDPEQPAQKRTLAWWWVVLFVFLMLAFIAARRSRRHGPL